MMESPTIANVGTPLMWLGCGHLVVLNLLIGLGEGKLLAWFGKVSFKRAAPVMIVANYVSGIAGYWLLPGLLRWVEMDWFTGPPLYRAGRTLGALVLVAFVLTVVIELPFVLWTLAGSSRRTGARLCAAVWVQGASYAALAVLYLAVSPMTVLTQCTRVRDVAGLAGGSRGWVYYVGPGDSEVRRARLDGTQDESFAPLPAGSHADDFGSGLWARAEEDGSVTLLISPSPWRVVRSGIHGTIGDRDQNPGTEGTASNWPIDFRARDARPDSFIAMPFAEEGLKHREWYDDASDHWARETYRVNFANPLWSWYASFPTILPGGEVVFSFGGQVVVMDGARRIGVLAIGQSPVVVLDAPGSCD